MRVRVKVFDTDYSTDANKFISKFVLDVKVLGVQRGVEHNQTFSKGPGQLDFSYKVRLSTSVFTSTVIILILTVLLNRLLNSSCDRTSDNPLAVSSELKSLSNTPTF